MTGFQTARRSEAVGKPAALLFACLFALAPGVGFAQSEAPAAGAAVGAFLSDNHAGHFFYLAGRLDRSASYCLLLFDAHPDASPLPDYPAVRRRLRAGEPVEPGRVQCFDWIHPLTPLPVADLVWVPAAVPGVDLPYDLRRFETAIGRWLPKGKAAAVPFERLDRVRFAGKNIAVSIDLDYFARSSNPAGDIAEVFRFIAGLERVDCIAVAISRPYLSDDDFANRCAEAALRELLRRPDVPLIEIGARGPGLPDSSVRARQLRKAGLPVPEWDLDRAPSFVKELVRKNAGRFLVREPAALRQP